MPFTADELRYVLRILPHLQSLQGHRVMPYSDLDKVCPDIKYFTFMRDPLRQCASWFQHLVQALGRTDLVFEEHIQEKWHRNRQTQMLAGTDDVDAAVRVIHEKNVFVGLVERFDESLLLLQALVVPDLKLGYERRGVAPSNELAKNLLTTERTRQMIVEATAADQQLYEYVKDELYPTYQQAYGDALPADVERYQASRGGFNYLNVNLSRLQQRVIFKPLIYLYRRGIKVQSPLGKSENSAPT